MKETQITAREDLATEIFHLRSLIAGLELAAKPEWLKKQQLEIQKEQQKIDARKAYVEQTHTTAESRLPALRRQLFEKKEKLFGISYASKLNAADELKLLKQLILKKFSIPTAKLDEPVVKALFERLEEITRQEFELRG